MSGYLQRMALRATQSPEAVHPVLGSVFEPTSREAERGFAQFEQDVVVSGISCQSKLTLEPDAARQYPDAHSVASRATEDTASRKAANPPVPGTAQPEVSTAVPTERHWMRPLPAEITQEMSRETQSLREAATFNEIREADGPLPPAYRPLVRASTGSSISEEPAGPEQRVPTFTNGRREPSDSSHPPGGAEPDEIQIHIGRIEVTAVPPAPPRAAFKPVRKGMSLDDYLRGRNRRA